MSSGSMPPLREAVAKALAAWQGMPRWQRAELERVERLKWIAARLRCAADEELEGMIATEIAGRLP